MYSKELRTLQREVKGGRTKNTRSERNEEVSGRGLWGWKLQSSQTGHESGTEYRKNQRQTRQRGSHTVSHRTECHVAGSKDAETIADWGRAYYSSGRSTNVGGYSVRTLGRSSITSGRRLFSWFLTLKRPPWFVPCMKVPELIESAGTD